MSARPRGPFLPIEEVASRIAHLSLSALHKRTRTDRVPHVKLPGHRRCLFVEEEVVAWLGGAQLERVNLPNGGKWVRPLPDEAARAGGET